MNGNRTGITRTNVFILIGGSILSVILVVSVLVLPSSLNRARESARRAACSMNLSSISKGIFLYQSSYQEKYPALASQATHAQGAIDKEPEMVSITDPMNASAFFDGDVKGNGSVNAYYLLVSTGYVEEDYFKCPSDDSFEAPKGRGHNLGFDGWKNLSYALQPTSLDAAAFSARVGNRSKGKMAIASDQVVDRDTALTTTDNRPKENNAVNHGYEYANVLMIDGSMKQLSRTKGADSTVSKWGYDGDEIYDMGMKGKAYPNVTKQVSDSILIGKEGDE